MNLKFINAMGYILIVGAIVIAIILSINPERILVDGNSLDTGYVLSKTLFIMTALILLSILGVQLINKKTE